MCYPIEVLIMQLQYEVAAGLPLRSLQQLILQILSQLYQHFLGAKHFLEGLGLQFCVQQKLSRFGSERCHEARRWAEWDCMLGSFVHVRITIG